MRSYIIHAPVTISLWLPVADETVGPGPLDVLHCAALLLEHNVAEAGVVGGGGAIGDGEIAARDVAVEEDVDLVDEAGAVLGIGRQGELAVG